MTVVAKAHATPKPATARAAVRMAALPVTFAGTVGLYMPAAGAATAGSVAVLLVSPWGYEEMCVRKLWRQLAEDLGDAGIASLRFDHPGTGDALPAGMSAGDTAASDDPAAGLARWRAAIAAAAATLRSLSGVTDLVLIGHGLGATLAAEAAPAIGDVEGLALLAPVLSGRSYLRELSVWARMTGEVSEPPAAEAGSLVISGLTLPAVIVEDIRGIKLAPTSAPVRNCLIAARPDRPAETALGDDLRRLGSQVETLSYDGYDQLCGNLIFSKPPLPVIEAVVNWVKWVEATRPGQPPAPRPLPAPVPLQGEGFVETPVRFGPGDRLYGILCAPADGVRRGATVLMLTTAYERLAGWGGIATRTARDLAAAGIVSLRFDAASAGDSPPVAGAPEQIIYSEAQHDDVDAAVAFLSARALLPLVVAGRCSGGYLAVRIAARDRRFRGAVSVNPYVFYWDGRQSVEELMQFVPQQLSSYGVKLFRADTWRRIASGDIKLKYAVLNTVRALGKRSLKLAGPLIEALPALSRERREVHAAFQAIERHGTDLSLLYSAGDVGLAHFAFHFGADGAKLAKYPHARFAVIADADHDLTTAHAKAVYTAEIKAMALKFPPAER